jgi:Flp pilus assembly pilin Flp
MSILPWRFAGDEQGQDLIEYTLLVAFLALTSAALFAGAGSSVEEIWSHGKSRLEAANRSVAKRPQGD